MGLTLQEHNSRIASAGLRLFRGQSLKFANMNGFRCLRCLRISEKNSKKDLRKIILIRVHRQHLIDFSCPHIPCLIFHK